MFFFRRHNFGIILAVAMCSLVLTGALTIGDSVRSTLRNLAEQRIGNGDVAMLSPDGFFEETLATRINQKLDNLIIPNYFNPYLQKNIEIYFFVDSKKIDKVRLFKGDGDQDRPT